MANVFFNMKVSINLIICASGVARSVPTLTVQHFFAKQLILIAYPGGSVPGISEKPEQDINFPIFRIIAHCEFLGTFARHAVAGIRRRIFYFSAERHHRLKWQTDLPYAACCLMSAFAYASLTYFQEILIHAR